MRTIHVDAFDKKSIEHAKREIKAVKLEWQRKADLCCEAVAAMLADMIQANLDAIPYTDDLIDVKTHQPMPMTTDRSILSASAIGNLVYVTGVEVAFVEFGAGVYHNSGMQNPLVTELNAVHFPTEIGSYGKGQGNQPYWFVAHNLISRGTPMYMPIYRAILAIEPEIPTIVRSIFV